MDLDMAFLTASAYVACWYVKVCSIKSYVEVLGSHSSCLLMMVMSEFTCHYHRNPLRKTPVI